MSTNQDTRPPLPPFTRETATQKVRMAEDGWNLRSPEKIALAYTPDSVWRNRSEFLSGREEIVQFLKIHTSQTKQPFLSCVMMGSTETPTYFI